MSYQTLSGAPINVPPPEDEPSINRLPKMHQAVQRFELEAREAREAAQAAQRKAEDLTTTAEKARAELIVALRDELQLLTGDRAEDLEQKIRTVVEANVHGTNTFRYPEEDR